MNFNNIDKNHIWHPYTQEKTSPPSLLITKAKGSYLYTEDGRKIYDAISSWWVNLHGHSNPYINEKIKNQLDKLQQIIFAGHTHQEGITVAKKILELLPSPFSRVFFSDNGSTSVEIALKMALQFWHNHGQKKNRIIAFKGGYHRARSC